MSLYILCRNYIPTKWYQFEFCKHWRQNEFPKLGKCKLLTDDFSGYYGLAAEPLGPIGDSFVFFPPGKLARKNNGVFSTAVDTSTAVYGSKLQHALFSPRIKIGNNRASVGPIRSFSIVLVSRHDIAYQEVYRSSRINQDHQSSIFKIFMWHKHVSFWLFYLKFQWSKEGNNM